MTAICWERLDRKHRLVMYGWKQLSLHVLLSFVNSYMCMCVAFVIHPFIPVWKHLYMGELKPIYSPFKPSFMWSWIITEWKGHETMKGSCKLWIVNYQVPDSELSDTGLWAVKHWHLTNEGDKPWLCIAKVPLELNKGLCCWTETAVLLDKGFLMLYICKDDRAWWTQNHRGTEFLLAAFWNLCVSVSLCLFKQYKSKSSWWTTSSFPP